MARARGWIGTGSALILAGACHLVGGTENLYIDEGFTAGTGGLTASGGHAGEGGVDGGAGMGGAGMGGEGGTPMMCVAAECPASDTVCREPACINGTCGYLPVEIRTDCTEGGSYCDGAGHCVECVDNAHCSGGGTCQEFICHAQTCANGLPDPGETAIDCGGPCGGCGNGQACLDDDDCQSFFCNVDTCNACGSSADCPGDRYCSPGNDCESKRDPGEACIADVWCISDCCLGVCAIFGC